jgi:hypothetical protein
MRMSTPRLEWIITTVIESRRVTVPPSPGLDFTSELQLAGEVPGELQAPFAWLIGVTFC